MSAPNSYLEALKKQATDLDAHADGLDNLQIDEAMDDTANKARAVASTQPGNNFIPSAEEDLLPRTNINPDGK